MIRCDAHMHTRFSEDSDASVHSMLDAAIERGMEAVCITAVSYTHLTLPTKLEV